MIEALGGGEPAVVAIERRARRGDLRRAGHRRAGLGAAHRHPPRRPPRRASGRPCCTRSRSGCCAWASGASPPCCPRAAWATRPSSTRGTRSRPASSTSRSASRCGRPTSTRSARWAGGSSTPRPGTTWPAWRTPRRSSSGGWCCRSPSRTSPRATASSPPKAVVLFGPPGTGKTTFAKAVAGRLGWPFVEIFPSRLAAEGPGGQAAALREFFEQVHDVEHLVLFIDEVDEIAGARAARPDTEGVVERAAEGASRLPRARRPAAGVRHQLGARPRPRAAAPRALRLRAADRAARRRRRARRSGSGFDAAVTAEPVDLPRAGRRDRALHPRRHRVRGPQGGPGGLRARAGRRAPTPRHGGRLRGPPSPPRGRRSPGRMVRDFEEDIERFART